MALPTPSTAYTASANNTITSNGPLPSQWQNRASDIAYMLCTLTTRLIQSGFATHYSSSVPTARNTGDNLWNVDDPTMETGISEFGNTLINAATTYGSNIWQPVNYGYTYISWIVLNLTQGGQLCIGFYFPTPLDINRSGFKISYSPSSDFASSIPSLTDLQIPTAIDEIKLYDNGFAPIDAGSYNYWRAIFDNDYQGILNTAQNRGNYNLQVQVVTANDNSAFWMGAFRDNDCAQFMYFSFGLENPVPNGPWSTCPIFYIDRGPIFSRIVENNSTSLLKAAFTSPSASSGWTFGGAALYSRNQFSRWNPSIDDDLEEYAIFPVPFYAFSPTSLGHPTGQYTGIKGLFKDMWLGQTQTSPAVYPATGSVELVQVNDFILPWDTNADAPLFIG